MKVRPLLLSLALGASMVPAAAVADHDKSYRCGDRHHPRRGPGHYELRDVQRWVEGHYADVWVPERCRELPPRRHLRFGRVRKAKVVCDPGHYESRWIPGQYIVTQRWVWVPRFG